jgi:Protein of unknown function (DUF732)
MTEHQDDTMAAAEVVGSPTVGEPTDHTTASALGADADTTWVPTDLATVDAYAWGTEPSDDELNERLSPPLRHPWTRALAIAAGVLALGTVTAVVVATSGQHGNDLHGSALPVTVHSSAAAPVLSAPVVTTVTVVPTPVAAPGTCDKSQLRMIEDEHGYPSVVCTMPSVTTMAAPVLPVDKDARFMALIAPLHLPPKYLERITEVGPTYCRDIAEGNETRSRDIANGLQNAPDLTVDQVTVYVDSAIEVYCPQYAN